MMNRTFPWSAWLNNCPLQYQYFSTSNEAVHQTSTLARIAARAGSGATALLEAFFILIFLYCILRVEIKPLRDWVQKRTSPLRVDNPWKNALLVFKFNATSNEAVHQTSTLARFAARAGSGATALLEAFLIFFFYFYFKD